MLDAAAIATNISTVVNGIAVKGFAVLTAVFSSDLVTILIGIGLFYYFTRWALKKLGGCR